MHSIKLTYLPLVPVRSAFSLLRSIHFGDVAEVNGEGTTSFPEPATFLVSTEISRPLEEAGR